MDPSASTATTTTSYTTYTIEGRLVFFQKYSYLGIILFIIGFFKEFRPSDPFLFEYLVESFPNVTQEEILQTVYPVGIYSTTAQILIFFFIMDACKYNSVMVTCGIAGLMTTIPLIWTNSLESAQISQVFAGTYAATEDAYYFYIYAKLSNENYKEMTVISLVSTLFGRTLSGFVGQLLLMWRVVTYKDLFYVTFCAMLISTLFSYFIPTATESNYFYRSKLSEEMSPASIKASFLLMKNHLLSAYKEPKIIMWSFWWAYSTCLFYQVRTFIQVFFRNEITHINKISGSHHVCVNGLVEGIYSICSFSATVIAKLIPVNWHSSLGDLLVSTCSLFTGVFLLFSAEIKGIINSYVFYVLIGVFQNFMYTVAYVEISKLVHPLSLGLIYTCNIFATLVLQSIVTYLIVQDRINKHVGIMGQYYLYGICFMILAVIFICVGLYQWLRTSIENV